MNKPAQPRVLVARIQALADVTRLRLLRLLERRELGVAELCDALQLPQSTVSRHLKLLADQGWAASRRDGTSNLYRMVPRELDPAARALWRTAREECAQWATARQDELRLAARLEERRGASRSFFNHAAGSWDAVRRELYGEEFLAAALAALLPREWTVADLGCGAGHLAAALAPRVARVVGVDQSEAMLAAARARTAPFANVELLPGELEALPLESGSCDAALMILTLCYLPDPAPALAEMARALRPGGRAVVVDLLAHDREDFRRAMGQAHAGFDPGRLAELLSDAGFARADVRPLPPAPGAKGPALFVAAADRG